MFVKIVVVGYPREKLVHQQTLFFMSSATPEIEHI